MITSGIQIFPFLSISFHCLLFFDVLHFSPQLFLFDSWNWNLLMHLVFEVTAGVGNVFAIGEVQKKLELFEMHTSFGPGAKKLFRYKWRKLDTLVFFFVELFIINAWLTGKKLISFCGSRFRTGFSLNALLLKRLHLVSKTDLTTKGLIWSFLLERASFLCNHI